MLDDGFPHLRTAPITEAAIEIRASLPLPVTDETYERMALAVAEKFPVRSAMRLIEVPHIHIESETEVQATTAMMRIGVRLESLDKKVVVQAKNDGLVVSRLAPYESWETLIADVRSLWAVYCRFFAPTMVTRLGVRYINRIELEFVDGLIDFDTVFTAAPQIPAGLPQSLESFATRIVIPMSDQGATLAIVQALEVPAVDGPLVGVLDLDAFTNTLMKPDTPDMWDQLDRLHWVKNTAFFSSILKPIWEKYL